MKDSEIRFGIGIRGRWELGPSVGITYLCSVGEGDWNELSIDLLLFSIIIIWE